MAEIIRFPPPRGPRYEEALTAAREALAHARSELTTAALNLAMAGAWREFDEQQPVDTVLTFDPELLHETGDARVTELMEIVDALDLALDDDLPF